VPDEVGDVVRRLLAVVLLCGREGEVQIEGTVLLDGHDLQFLAKVRLGVRPTRELGVANVLVGNVCGGRVSSVS
jgi:hypothetical protein